MATIVAHLGPSVHLRMLDRGSPVVVRRPCSGDHGPVQCSYENGGGRARPPAPGWATPDPSRRSRYGEPAPSTRCRLVLRKSPPDSPAEGSITGTAGRHPSNCCRSPTRRPGSPGAACRLPLARLIGPHRRDQCGQLRSRRGSTTRIRASYQLGDDGLSCFLEAENCGTRPAPPSGGTDGRPALTGWISGRSVPSRGRPVRLDLRGVSSTSCSGRCVTPCRRQPGQVGRGLLPGLRGTCEQLTPHRPPGLVGFFLLG